MLTHSRRKKSTLVKRSQSSSLIILEIRLRVLPKTGLIINRLLTIAALPGANLIKDYK